MEPRRNPDLAALALAALSCAAALSLGRAFSDGSYVAPVLGAAVLPHLLGFAARRWRWPGIAVLALSVLGLVAYAVWTIEPSTTWYGLPAARSLEVLGRHLDAGWTVLRTGVAPVAVDPGPLLLAVGGAWLVAMSADWLAFRLDATVGAVVPGLVLFVMAATLGTADFRTTTTLGFASTTAAFLLLQHSALLERRRAWFSGRYLGSVSNALAVGASLGVVAVVVGALAGPAVPGADGAPLVDYRRLGGRRNTASEPISVRNPFVNIGADYLRVPKRELFTVKVTPSTGLYYRFAALNRFDGEGWKLDAVSESVREKLPADPPPGSVRQDYAITGPLVGQWIPAAFEPRSISFRDARLMPDLDALFTTRHDIAGRRYAVGSLLPKNPSSQAQVDATSGPIPRDIAERYMQLPRRLPDEVRAQAAAITQGVTTRFEKAKKLEQFFTEPGRFVYSLDVHAGSGTNAIVAFLRNKIGFCEQFAGTFAAMARSIGLPARVAVGFTTGTPDAADPSLFHVSTEQAHAWVEAWLSPELGWVTFEPTPAGFAPGMAPVLDGAQPPGQGPSTPPPTATSTAGPPPTPSAATATTQSPATTPRGRAPGSGSSTAWLLGVGIPLVLAALVGAYVGLVLGLKTRRRALLRDAPDPRVVVTGAWETALDRLADSGMPARPSLTPLELASALPSRRSEELAMPVRALAQTYSAARYAPEPPSVDDARLAWERVDELDRVLSATENPRQRWRRKLDPRPLVTRR